jgi:hypothetical protein
VAQVGEIDRLEAQKRLLAAESEALRQTLARDLAPLANTVAWVEQGLTWARALRVFWPLAAAAAGFAATRERGGWWRMAGKAWSIWRMASQVLTFWRERTRSASRPE